MEDSLFQKAIGILRGGGLVIAPTETFYGILGNPWSGKAVKRLVQLKGRDFGKPIPLIAGSIETVRDMSPYIPPIFTSLAKKFWPGPLTLVLKAPPGLPPGVTAGTDSIGIRIPAQSPAQDLTRFYRGPLTATSANFQGISPPRSVSELDSDLAAGVDLVIDGGWTPGGLPSTVLNLVSDPPMVIRWGALGKEVEGFLEEMGRRGNRE